MGCIQELASNIYVTRLSVDSVEYKCWHEVGHATVCLHLGGDVDFIELLDGDARGHARATERSVACGGFAAEFYLLNSGVDGIDSSPPLAWNGR